MSPAAGGSSVSVGALSTRLGRALGCAGLQLVTAESCTGGWLAQEITAIAGSSAWFERGFIAYSDLAKREMLGVKATTLTAHGAVSEEVVREMALGALARSGAQVAAAVSGIAGPTGGSPIKPVGTVCLAWASGGGSAWSRTGHYRGSRRAIRRQSVIAALAGLLEHLAIIGEGQADG